MTIKKETFDLIRSYKAKWGLEFINRFNVVQERFTPVMTPVKKKKGNWVFNIDTVETKSRLTKRLSTFSVPSVVMVTDNTAPCVHGFSVAVVANEFKIIHSLIPLTNRMMQKALRLNCEIIDWEITTHAVARYLERNNTTDVKHALYVLGSAMRDCDQGLGNLEIKYGLVPRGYAERQVKCIDGGIAFILIHDPADGCYRTMEWVLVSYISADMVRDWNEAAAASEFDGLEKRQQKRRFYLC